MPLCSSCMQLCGRISCRSRHFMGIVTSSKPAEELKPGSYAISLILMGLLSPGEREITLKAASRTTYQHGVFPHQRDCVRADLCGKVHPGILLVLLSRLLSNTSF